ncbi:MAG: hypothetical protein ACFFF9_05960 [Candidatus Thorarchaeota archaeon]
MIKKKMSFLTLTFVLCLILPAIFVAPETSHTRTMEDIIGNQDAFAISQEVVWSDDFDHGNITESGWSVQGFSPAYPPWTKIPGNITADDKTLRAYGPYWNEAWRTSNVAYGSWAFDVHCVDTPTRRSYIAFVSASPVVDPPNIYSMPFEYGIITVVGYYEGYTSAFLLYRRPSTTPYLSVIGDYDVADVTGWWHINITRDYNGNFNVYFNDTLRITANNSDHTTSDLFTFTAEAGNALDNIVVVSYPDVYGPNITNPVRTPYAPNSTESVLVNVDVFDPSGVDAVILSYHHGTTWINITMNSTGSDYEGTIPALPNGTDVQYRFYANDTIGNWADYEPDSYTVEDLPGPTPTTPRTSSVPLDPIFIGGGIALVLIVLVVVFVKRR